MKKYMPYNINTKYEFKTYKNIGRKHKLDYIFSNKILSVIYGCVLLCVNKDEKKYRNFTKFSDWEEYVKEMIKNTVNNNKKIYRDLVYYLESRRKYYKELQSLIANIAVPAYMALPMGVITIFCSDNFEGKNFLNIMIIKGFYWIFFGLLVIFIMIILHKMMVKYIKQYLFYSDFVKIIKKNKKFILPTIKNK